MALTHENKVRPGFALSIAILFSLLVSLVTSIQLETLVGAMTLTFWVTSSLFIGCKGYIDQTGNALTPLKHKYWDALPITLALVGAIAIFMGFKEPGVFSIILSFIWTLIAPTWRKIWKSKFVQLSLDIASAIHVLFFVLAIVVAIVGW